MSSHFGFPTLVDDELGIFLYPRSWNTNENLKQCEEANERDLRQDVTERIKTGILTILKSLSETETTLTQKKSCF